MDQAIVNEKFSVSERNRKFKHQVANWHTLDLPLRIFILVYPDPESWEEVKVPTDSFNTRHETQIYKCLAKDVARHSSSKENVEKLMIGFVESFDCHIKFLVNSFDVCKCLGTWDVHLDHWSWWSRNVFRLPS